MGIQEGYSNFILWYKIIYFATSRNFPCMFTELEKYVQDEYQKFIKIRGFVGPFIRTITFFSCGHSSIHCSHVEMEFGKNSKAKIVHANERKLYPTLLGRPVCTCSY